MQIPWTTFVLGVFINLKIWAALKMKRDNSRCGFVLKAVGFLDDGSVLFSRVSTELKKLICMCLLGSMKQRGDTSGILLLLLNTVSQDSTLQRCSMRLVFNPPILSFARERCSHKDFKWAIALMRQRARGFRSYWGIKVFLGWNVNGETRAAWMFWWEGEY